MKKVNKLTVHPRAQVTIFMIVAVVIISVFGFLYYLSSQLSAKATTPVDASIDNLLQSSSFKYYVKLCLEDSAARALRLVGSQGGFIFADQNFSVVGFNVPRVNFSGSNLTAVQIYSDLNSGWRFKGSAKEPPPFYPCGLGLSDFDLDLCYRSYSHSSASPAYSTNLFGTRLTPRPRRTPNLCEASTAFCNASFVPDGERTNVSIERQLSNYVANALLGCINLSLFSSYNISVRNVSVNISFTDSAVLFYADFPISLRYRDSMVTRILSFFVSQPARIKPLYDFWREIVFRDITNLSFDIVDDGNQLAGSDERTSPFRVVRLPFMTNGVLNASYHIVRLTDTLPAAFAGSDEFFFRFAIENRYPALNYISNPDGARFGADLHVIEGEEIKLKPEAVDPDDSALAYSYSGWLVDWNDIYSSPDCTGAAAESRENGIPYYGPNVWQSSEDYNSDCLHSFYGFTSGRCADYRTTCRDIGYHNITITAADPAGRSDFQLVRIVVDDKPWVQPQFYSFYEYSPSSLRDLGSVEDPFVLNASVSRNIVGGSILHKWDVSRLSDHFEVPAGAPDSTNVVILDPLSVLPAPSEPSVALVQSRFSAPGEHSVRILLADSDNPSIASELNREVDVKQCIPHRSTAAPAPFNDLPDAIADSYTSEPVPLLGSHACCDDSSNLRTAADVCYELEDYGSASDFSNAPRGNLAGALQDSGKPWPDCLSDCSDASYVYRRTVKRYCDGIRGNVCNGTVVHSLERTAVQCPEPGTGKSAECNAVHYGSSSCLDLPAGTPCAGGTCDRGGYCVPN